ncbi:DUF420 domain-containing protein [Ichthyobacterium seriolicida]|uniref:DUF420 domain-containing protein n=1 Tax=Ichthyobacterium seriolicida TaxID=242600 RepID=A0A1J1E3J6_9FLAO|nr:DUF420 domain-containing protein [Ichthyobacterium seriolicida]BAV94620.1 hypothetical protein JBKA6_0607 [Ichthyobacterium seriolicida]
MTDNYFRLKRADKIFIPVISIISIIIPIVVGVLIYLPDRYNIFDMEAGTLPLFHALLNASTAVLLFIALYQIKNRRIESHKRTMLMALGLSILFLLSYVISKIQHPPVAYRGEGFYRYLYFFILITHILLSAVVVPLCLLSVYRGLTRNDKLHKKISRWTFPIWMYVAITGVLVYVMMRPYY